MKDIGDDVWEFVRLAELSDAGHLPVIGGTLDQTASFFDSYAIYLPLVNRLKPNG